MSEDVFKRIDARQLKAELHDGKELALLDAREELLGRKNYLIQTWVPLSRFGVDGRRSRAAPRAWYHLGGDGDGLAERAAARMVSLGYHDVAVLDGGLAAWEAAGFKIYSGIHVPLKSGRRWWSSTRPAHRIFQCSSCRS